MPERKLFSPYTLGGLTLPNRIAMAPMTRCRADADAVPTPIMAGLYAALKPWAAGSKDPASI